MRIRDLADVLGDLDLRLNRPVRALDSHELVDAAEDRLALGRDEALADAERCRSARPARMQVLDEVFVERVRARKSCTFRPAGLVEHFAGLLRQVRHVAGVEADTALADAEWAQHLVERADGVRHTALERVVGVDEQNGIRRVQLAVALEGLIFAVEHLHPRMGHRAAREHAVELIGDRAGRSVAAADVGSARAEDSSLRALRPAGAELQHAAALRRADDAVGFCGDEALVVQRRAKYTFRRAAPRWPARGRSGSARAGKTGVPSGTA